MVIKAVATPQERYQPEMRKIPDDGRAADPHPDRHGDGANQQNSEVSNIRPQGPAAESTGKVGSAKTQCGETAPDTGIQSSCPSSLPSGRRLRELIIGDVRSTVHKVDGDPPANDTGSAGGRLVQGEQRGIATRCGGVDAEGALEDKPVQIVRASREGTARRPGAVR